MLVQAMLQGTDRPPDTGPMGRALQSVRQLRGEAVRGWLVWHVPGQCEQLHLVLACFGEVCHRMRESQRYTALAALERRRPATFGGLGAEVCKLACTLGMTLASSETERSLLRALQAGLTWTGVRVRKHQISDLATCPYCCPPRMVTCELSRVCWLRRNQHNRQHMQITRRRGKACQEPRRP